MARSTVMLAILLTVAIGAGAQEAAEHDPEATAILLEMAPGFGTDVKKAIAAIEAGADVDAFNADGVTALMMASANGRDETVNALIEAGATVDKPTENGMTALMYASVEGEDDAVKALLAAGADVNATSEGWTPLMLAANNRATRVVPLLIAAEADLEVVLEDGMTALNLALYRGSDGIVEKLLEAGAKVAETSPSGTPLFLAVFGGDSSVVLQVLETGADINARDNEKWTPLILAAARGETEIVMELLRADADTTLKDEEGMTALERATTNGHEEVAALLGGPWDRRKPEGGSTVSVPCEPLGGAVDFNIRLVDELVEFSAYYPKPVGYYLGGFTDGGKTVSADADFHLDTDRDPSTGLGESWAHTGAKGAEFSISFSEIRTSVSNPNGDGYVSRQVMDVSVEKGNDYMSSEDMGGHYAIENRDLNRLWVTVPLSAFGLEPGAEIRLTAKAGFCDPVTETVRVGEAPAE
jgi:ankyrin repeat protein/Fe2+ transport system protein FeoA